MAGEADLVADLGGVFLDPRVGRVGQHLAADEGFDAAVFQQRHLLGVAQVGVGLVLDDGGLAVHGRLEQAAQRVGLGLAGLVHLGDDGRRGLDAPAHGLEDLLQVGGGELDAGLLERGVHAVAEDVVVLEERRRPAPSRSLVATSTRRPSRSQVLGSSSFFFFFSGRPFFALPPSSSSPSSSSPPHSARRFSSAAETLAKLVKRSSPNSS